jgi:hypothetical protein
MTSDPTTASRGLEVPWDLTEIVDSKILAARVTSEISTLNWSNPELVEHLKAHPNYHPRMMLTVLTYAYSSGIFESEEIIQRCDADPMFRAMSVQAVPESVAAIRQFRKDNRALLKWSLVQILKRCLLPASENGDMNVPAGVKRLLVDNAVSRLELAAHMDRAMHEI